MRHSIPRGCPCLWVKRSAIYGVVLKDKYAFNPNMPCRIFPSDLYAFDNSPSLHRELDTLRTLQQGLSQGYCVFHSVHWTRALNPKSMALGEIDFVVMNRAGELLLIEQKTGPLTIENGEIWKSYGNSQPEKSVLVQIQRNQDGLLNKFRKLTNKFLKTQNVLFCPDYKILNAKVSGLERNQIIDATDAEHLCSRLVNLLPEGESDPAAKDVERFLKNELLIQEDLVKISAAQDSLTTRLSSGLTEWVARLDLNPYRLRVQGTAGSGKTQLAISELNKADQLGLKSLYVSFNKPLAQHMSEILPSSVKATSFYAFCEELVRAEDASLSNKSGFVTDSIDELFLLAAAVEPSTDVLYDLVVVDEGQDFTQEQSIFLRSWCRPQGKMLWLDDPMQNIYLKPTVELKDWARLRAPVNYRNPKPIAQFLAYLADSVEECSGEELIGANPIEGFPIEFIQYRKGDLQGLKDSTESAIEKLIKLGFKSSQITVLSFKGLAHSELMKMNSLFGLSLKKPKVDGLGQYTQGDLEVDTLYRYKGLSNMAIVLTEIEFDSLSPRMARLLFVGASRAKLALALVHSSPIEKLYLKS